MASLDEKVAQVLKGTYNSLEESKLCIADKKWQKKGPVLGKTVTYVVAVVLLNDEKQVLLTQEGFEACMGQWYLPAGRVDPKETLLDAAQRELKEETGMEFEPLTLLVVECPSGGWYRFTFTGRVTGGKLRTLKEEDEETLQAQWWDIDHVLSAPSASSNPKLSALENFVLRGRDIFPLIQAAQGYHALSDEERHPKMLPLLHSLNKLIVRPLIVTVTGEAGSEEVHALMQESESGQRMIPELEFTPSAGGPVHHIKSDLLQGHGLKDCKMSVHGLLQVEHDGVAAYSDGMCLTLLVQLHNPVAQAANTEAIWHHVANQDTAKEVIRRLAEKKTVIFRHR